MRRSGRPLRFLAMTLGGWTALRVAMLWPETALVPAVVKRIAAVRPDARMGRSPPVAAVSYARLPGQRATRASAISLPGGSSRDPERPTLAMMALVRFGAPQVAGGPLGMMIAPVFHLSAPGRSRWSGSAWLVARDGGARGASFGGGQLGGSQAGARLVYALDRARRVSAVLRVDGPLRGKGREAALGVEWRPTRLPVRIVAEDRVSLDGGGNAPAAGVIGGIGPLPIAGRFRFEAYGQAGAIARNGISGFADGAARIARSVGRFGAARFDLGGGAWGGAQRGAARLDIGPSLGVALPVGRLPVRIALDWRQRVAGHARPGSGLALTLGADF